MRGEAGGQHRVRGKGTAVGPVDQEPDAAKLRRHQDASLGRSCFGTVIAKSRTAVPAVGLRVEDISVMGENSRAPILGQPIDASRPGPPCQVPNTQCKHGLLA